jgi:hypothetical protein
MTYLGCGSLTVPLPSAQDHFFRDAFTFEFAYFPPLLGFSELGRELRVVLELAEERGCQVVVGAIVGRFRHL